MSSSIHFSSLLKKCSETLDLNLTKNLHCLIIKSHNFLPTFLSNSLINLYSKLNNCNYARKVFDEMPQPNLFSWNIILSSYSKAGRVFEMRDVFSRIPDRDGISWNAYISGYLNSGWFKDGVLAYKLMLEEGRESLNRITFSTMIILALDMECVDLGRQIHGQIVKFGFGVYVFVGNPLVDMYSKLGRIHDAKRVFDEMLERNLVMYNTMVAALLRTGMVEDAGNLFRSMREKDSISWTTMVGGLAQKGLFREAVDVVREMRLEGIFMDQFTFGTALTACGGIRALKHGKELHAYVIRTDYEVNVYVGSALVDMYCKCNDVTYAKRIFERMTHKNTVSWTAMLVGYGQNGLNQEAVKIFSEMQKKSIDPDDFTLGSVISSCANLANLEEGVQFHGLALVSGLISFITVSNALITLYGRCGSLEDSDKMFNEMNIRDEVSWTALISGYAQFGKANETINLFEEMLGHSLKPDVVSFVGVLSACSRAGLVAKGQKYFESMEKEHGIVPVSDHYTCMIDLYARSGRLQEVKRFITQMPFTPDAIGWATLLSSCRRYGNVEIAKWASDSLLQLEPHNPAGYILLSSIYASKGQWDNVAQLRKGMRDKRVRKEPGCSWIKIKNKVHIFSADDQKSPFRDQIYEELKILNAKIVEAGYKPDMSSVLHDVDESEKIRLLSRHSERLAIAFGLIFLPHGVRIRVVKNLRVCDDCHNVTKFISKVTQREILVRDAVRFHLFKDGTCSCGDFW